MNNIITYCWTILGPTNLLKQTYNPWRHDLLVDGNEWQMDGRWIDAKDGIGRDVTASGDVTVTEGRQPGDSGRQHEVGLHPTSALRSTGSVVQRDNLHLRRHRRSVPSSPSTCMVVSRQQLQLQCRRHETRPSGRPAPVRLQQLYWVRPWHRTTVHGNLGTVVNHVNHGNRDFRQMPWIPRFCQNTVFCRVFCQNAVVLPFLQEYFVFNQHKLKFIVWI